MGDNIFILGATGNIGSFVVKGLIANGVRTTIFAREEEKAKNLFSSEFSTGLLSLVKGDYDDEEIFASSIAGHTRLLMLIGDIERMTELKEKWGKIAYDSGVKQIVDISSFTVHLNKFGPISEAHTNGEESLRKVRGDNFLVILRPGYFMTNTLHNDTRTIKGFSKIIGPAPPEFHLPCVDPRDIADVALRVFLDPLETHGHVMVYDISPDPLTQLEKAQVYSRVLGREITYEQLPVEEVYNRMTGNGLSHRTAYDLISLILKDYSKATPQVCILTRKPVRTFEMWVEDNKDAFL